MFRLPLIIGHRGAKGVKTENTLQAFEYAFASNVKWAELDAMLSADGTAVVFHDETLERMCDGHAERVDSLTAERLRSLVLNGGGRIPTLMEVFETAEKFGASLNVEIKPSRPELARETALRVWETARSAGFTDPERLLFSSFEMRALEAVKEAAPEIGRGLLIEGDTAGWRENAAKIKAFSVHCDADLFTAGLAAEIKAAGYAPAAFTVNEVPRMQRLMQMGVETFFTDFPVEMSAAAVTCAAQ